MEGLQSLQALPPQLPSTWTQSQSALSASSFPVFVMLPLDTVWLAERDGVKSSWIKREQALKVGLQMLKQAGVKGIMIDVW